MSEMSVASVTSSPVSAQDTPMQTPIVSPRSPRLSVPPSAVSPLSSSSRVGEGGYLNGKRSRFFCVDCYILYVILFTA